MRGMITSHGGTVSMLKLGVPYLMLGYASRVCSGDPKREALRHGYQPAWESYWTDPLMGAVPASRAGEEECARQRCYVIYGDGSGGGGGGASPLHRSKRGAGTLLPKSPLGNSLARMNWS